MNGERRPRRLGSARSARLALSVGGVVAIAAGVGILLAARIDAPESDAPLPATHDHLPSATSPLAQLPGVALEPGAEAATLAAVVTPSAGITIVRSVSSATPIAPPVPLAVVDATPVDRTAATLGVNADDS
jgi:hypothetical protein